MRHSVARARTARMRGRLVGGLFIRHDGKTRRCFCEDCYHVRGSRAGEKRVWRREAIEERRNED